MKPIMILLLAASLSGLAYAQLGSGNKCVYRTTVWKTDGASYRTQIASRATNGCKEIEHSIDGGSLVEGVDCNCDLVADGFEAEFSPPPSYQAGALMKVCLGPIADPLTYEQHYSIEVIED